MAKVDITQFKAMIANRSIPDIMAYLEEKARRQSGHISGERFDRMLVRLINEYSKYLTLDPLAVAPEGALIVMHGSDVVMHDTAVVIHFG